MNKGSPRQSVSESRFRVTLVTWILLLLAGALLVSACGDLFSDENENTAPDSPVREDDTAETSDEDSAVTTTDDDGWRVVVAPDDDSNPENVDDGGVLRMAGPSDPPATVDPALVRDTNSSFIARQIFRGLVRLDSNLEPIPDLAERIEISPDGKTYRFELHDDITFHDGRPIVAEDVKVSLERATDPALTGNDGDELPARNYLDDIVGAVARMNGERDDLPGIRVIDQRTVEIELVGGVVDFLERLSNPVAHVVDVEQAAEGGDWWTAPNGTGPFRLEEWDPERRLELVAHDGYVEPALVDRVSIRVGAEAVGSVQLYETGEIDLTTVPLSVVDRVEYEGSPHDGDMRSELLLSTTFAMIDPNAEPFDDERIRRALLRAFPRDQVADVMLDGRAREAHGAIPPEMDVHSDSEFPYEYDPETARSLFSSAGIPEGEQITLYTSGGQVPVAMKTYYETELGTEVEVVQLRWSDFINDLEAGELPFYLITWVADGPDPVSYLRSLFHSESPDNYIGFSHPDVDALLDAAVIEQDNERRNQLLVDAHEIILESAVIMPLYHSVDYTLVADHVNGLETTPMGILGLESVRIEQ